MNGLSKYEFTGIVLSIAVMAGVLWFLDYQTTLKDMPKKEDGVSEVTKEGVTVKDTELATALEEVVSPKGVLTELVITDVREGEGEVVVKEGDTVTVHYIGTTRDGVKFDSSYDRGEPFVFKVGAGRVIAGWEKGLLGMKVGGQRILLIPSDMAYGNRQVGPIPPNSALVFAVELVEIK